MFNWRGGGGGGDIRIVTCSTPPSLLYSYNYYYLILLLLMVIDGSRGWGIGWKRLCCCPCPYLYVTMHCTLPIYIYKTSNECLALSDSGSDGVKGVINSLA